MSFGGARLWQHTVELRTPSVINIFEGDQHLVTPWTMFLRCAVLLTLKDYCLFMYHQSYGIMKGLLILPLTFTSYNQGLNLLPPDVRVKALIIQPNPLNQ